MNDKKFDQYIKERLAQDTYSVSPDAWTKVSQGLQHKKTPVRVWLGRIAAVLIIGCGLGLGYLYSPFYNAKTKPATLISVESRPVVIPSVKSELTTVFRATYQKSVISSGVKDRNHVNSHAEDNNIMSNNTNVLIAFQEQTSETKTTDDNSLISKQSSSNDPKLNISIPQHNYSFSINSDDLLQSVEAELASEKEPKLKDKIFYRIKTEINDRFALASN
ncbi:MAG: hypothetical protein CSA40_00810 [Flavobacteriales bacterium]|nr:MAG: hypothetical protein CSA40_00810 [Flavobacteriales bacterium]